MKQITENKNLENEHLWITDWRYIGEVLTFAELNILLIQEDSVGIELNLNITNKDYDVVHYYKVDCECQLRLAIHSVRKPRNV